MEDVCQHWGLVGRGFSWSGRCTGGGRTTGILSRCKFDAVGLELLAGSGHHHPQSHFPSQQSKVAVLGCVWLTVVAVQEIRAEDRRGALASFAEW